MEISAIAATPPLRPGQSAQAVGHLAKVAVAQARASGADLPKNAQGIASAEVAQSKFPESFFLFLAESEPLNPIDTGQAPKGEEPMTSAETGYAGAENILGGTGTAEDDTALDLLTGA